MQGRITRGVGVLELISFTAVAHQILIHPDLVRLGDRDHAKELVLAER
jgi:hypothetical protein